MSTQRGGCHDSLNLSKGCFLPVTFRVILVNTPICSSSRNMYIFCSYPSNRPSVFSEEIIKYTFLRHASIARPKSSGKAVTSGRVLPSALSTTPFTGERKVFCASQTLGPLCCWQLLAVHDVKYSVGFWAHFCLVSFSVLIHTHTGSPWPIPIVHFSCLCPFPSSLWFLPPYL